MVVGIVFERDWTPLPSRMDDNTERLEFVDDRDNESKKSIGNGFNEVVVGKGSGEGVGGSKEGVE